MKINLDYGWLRACGETSKLSDEMKTQAHELADRIVTGRSRSWYLDTGPVAMRMASRRRWPARRGWLPLRYAVGGNSGWRYRRRPTPGVRNQRWSCTSSCALPTSAILSQRQRSSC